MDSNRPVDGRGGDGGYVDRGDADGAQRVTNARKSILGASMQLQLIAEKYVTDGLELLQHAENISMLAAHPDPAKVVSFLEKLQTKFPELFPS